MKPPSTRTVLAVAGVLAVLNVALAYSNRGRIPGQNKLLDLNDSLLKLNPLALLFPPTQAAQGGTLAPGSVTNFAPAPVAQVTDQSGGTTTYWG